MKQNEISQNQSQAEIALKELLRGLDPAKAAVLVTVCQKYGLDPILKHAVLVAGNLYITRDGLLHVAHTSGQLDGIEVAVADDGSWAEATVHRKDMSRPFRYKVFRSEYDTKKGAWATHPISMLVKVAEVFALRRAFPVGLTPIEEMERVVEVVESEPPAESEAPGKSPSEAVMRLKIKRHMQTLGVPYEDVVAIWQNARHHISRQEFGRRILACKSADDWATFAMQFGAVIGAAEVVENG